MPAWARAWAKHYYADCEQALGRAALAANDAPQCTPTLNAVFDELDQLVANASSPGRAAMLRAGSIASHRAQTDYYVRMVANPLVKTVCEVGFNCGHSTALWLASNPTVVVHSFDLFSKLSHSRAAAKHLQQRWPGRLHIYDGSSLESVPRWARELEGRPCDLLHIDGKHSYENTVLDFLNLLPAAAPHAMALFDDQCNPAHCDGPPDERPPNAGFRERVAAVPTLATCDLVAAGLMAAADGFYIGNRQFAAFRPILSAARPDRGLPCSPLCQLRFHSENRTQRWAQHGGAALRKLQLRMRPSDCRVE